VPRFRHPLSLSVSESERQRPKVVWFAYPDKGRKENGNESVTYQHQQPNEAPDKCRYRWRMLHHDVNRSAITRNGRYKRLRLIPEAWVVLHVLLPVGARPSRGKDIREIAIGIPQRALLVHNNDLLSVLR